MKSSLETNLFIERVEEKLKRMETDTIISKLRDLQQEVEGRYLDLAMDMMYEELRDRHVL